jgi:hypothetical protein
MPLPSCGVSRSWLRNPRAPTSQRLTSSSQGDPDFPLRIAPFVKAASAQSGLAQWTDEAFLSDVGDQDAVLEEAAGRQAEAVRSGW